MRSQTNTSLRKRLQATHYHGKPRDFVHAENTYNAYIHTISELYYHIYTSSSQNNAREGNPSQRRSNNALPAFGIRAVAAALVHVPGRVLAVGAGVLDAERLGVVDPPGADQLLGGDALLDPAHHGHEGVGVRVEAGARLELVADGPGAVAAAAVAHAGDAEEAVEVVELGRAEAHGARQVIVVARAVVRADDGVHLAVVVQQLAALGLEGAQVVPGLDVARVLRGGVGHVLGGERERVPGRVVVNGVAEPIGGVDEVRASVQNVGGDDLAAGLHTGVDKGAINAVHAGEDLANSVSLRAGQAVGGVSGVGRAQKRLGAVLTEIRVLDNTVLNTIETIALVENILMNGGPQCLGDVALGVVTAEVGVEAAAPRSEVVESDGGRTGNDTVEVIREGLCRLETLATTSGASQVVRLGVSLAVESLGNVLADDNTSVDGTPGEVENNIFVLSKGNTASAIVAVVRTDGSKAKIRGIGEVLVLNAARSTAITSAQEATGPVGGKPSLDADLASVRGRDSERDTAHIVLNDLSGTSAARILDQHALVNSRMKLELPGVIVWETDVRAACNEFGKPDGSIRQDSGQIRGQ